MHYANEGVTSHPCNRYSVKRKSVNKQTHVTETFIGISPATLQSERESRDAVIISLCTCSAAFFAVYDSVLTRVSTAVEKLTNTFLKKTKVLLECLGDTRL